MAKQTDNILFYDAATGQPTLIGSHSVALSSDLEVGGNLMVKGTMTYVDSEILTSDAYLLLNGAYNGTIVQDGGFVVSTNMVVTPGNLISVTNATNTVVFSGVHALSNGDILALTQTLDGKNDSLFEVASATNNGVNTTAVLKSTLTSGFDKLLRSSADLVNEGQTAGAKVGKVSVAILRSDTTNSRFEYGFGASTAMTFEDIAGATLNLQTAYQNGNTISMSAAGGGFDVSPASGENVGISLDASAASNFSVTGGSALTLATASGNLLLQSSSGNIIGSTAGSTKLLSGSAEGASDTFGRFNATLNAVSVTANGVGSSIALASQGGVSITATGGDIDLDTIGTGDISLSAVQDLVLSGEDSVSIYGVSGSVAVAAGSDTVSVGALSLSATGGALNIATVANGSAVAGALDITAANAMSVTVTGNLDTNVSDGALSFVATNNGTVSPVSIASMFDGVTITAGSTVAVTSGTTMALTAGDASSLSLNAGLVAGTGTIALTSGVLDLNSGSATVDSTGTMALTAGSTLTASATTSATVSAPVVTLKGSSAGTSQQVVLKNDLDAAVVEVERDSTFNGTRLNQSVTIGSAVSGISGVKDVGVGLRVTVEAGVEIGSVLAVNINARFDKGLARIATEGASELPQNPIGVALANGQAAATTSDVFMSTVSGATVLVQLESVPSSSDIGKVVYLSPTTAGKGVIPLTPGSLLNGDGLTRVTQIGYLLNNNGVTVSGISGNITVYPMLWVTDHIVDG